MKLVIIEHLKISCEYLSVRDMIITYNKMHRTDQYSQHSSVTWSVWLNG